MAYNFVTYKSTLILNICASGEIAAKRLPFACRSEAKSWRPQI